MNRAAFLASRPAGSHWFAAIDEPAPGGESFMDLYNRVCGAIERINAEQAGKDMIAVAHGGTIKAAVGLALGGQPEKGLAFDIDNCSVTRLDHLASAGHSGWRLPMVNQQPWIADASHNAMHQPAGPEISRRRRSSLDAWVVESRIRCLVDLKNKTGISAGSTSGRET